MLQDDHGMLRRVEYRLDSDFFLYLWSDVGQNDVRVLKGINSGALSPYQPSPSMLSFVSQEVISYKARLQDERREGWCD